MEHLVRKIYGSAENVIYINIDVEIEWIYNIIESSEDIFATQRKLSAREWDEFNDFVENVRDLMETFYFEVDDSHPSNRKRSASHYFSFYPADHDHEPCYEYLYFLRISNHERQSEKQNPYPKYYHDTAQKYKKPKNKLGDQLHKKMEIIVNGEKYDDYDDAFEAVLKKFENIRKKCDKLNGK